MTGAAATGRDAAGGDGVSRDGANTPADGGDVRGCDVAGPAGTGDTADPGAGKARVGADVVAGVAGGDDPAGEGAAVVDGMVEVDVEVTVARATFRTGCEGRGGAGASRKIAAVSPAKPTANATRP